LGWTTTEYASRLAEWERWQPLAVAAHGETQAQETQA
jgi:hypothetical protein